MKASLTTELATLRGQMDKAKANVMVEFQVSQLFFDACSAYYGDGFDDYLKQVGSVDPDLDLSQFVIDDIVPPTPGGDDTISDEPDDSVHTVEQEEKDDGVVISQLVPEGPVAPIASSAIGSLSEGGPTTVDLNVSDAPPS